MYWLATLQMHSQAFSSDNEQSKQKPKNDLQNFQVGTSKWHSVKVRTETHTHTHTNIFNAHTKITKVDFCLQCSGSLCELHKRLKQPRTVAQSHSFELPVLNCKSNSVPCSRAVGPDFYPTIMCFLLRAALFIVWVE